ncbi:hypothetical protein DFR30_1494 [Thiogranum longum]|uniref:Nuclease-like protein n=2 Tax=Thiogranum longum TaxID=1537524 RepID=A0A4R1HFZ3_9GAMM|nr:hypothetical protein DFR30_1494 [Thiogranum longum]
MMKTTGLWRRTGWAMVCVLALSVSIQAIAATFIPYPGKRPVTLVRLDAPDRVVVTFNTDATGFFRTLVIKLPGIVVARDTPQSDDCEREAAQKALPFAQGFLESAKEIYVEDMRMENSADDEAVSLILTDKGSLSSALIKEGLARPASIDPDTPWCK